MENNSDEEAPNPKQKKGKVMKQIQVQKAPLKKPKGGKIPLHNNQPRLHLMKEL